MISVVVLAAGLSTRMGSQKLLRPVRGRPMLEKVLGVFRRAKVDEIVVVLGRDAERLRSEVRFHNERVVVNHEATRGMSSSLKLGLRSVSPRAEAAIVALGDQPFLSPSTVDLIVEGYRAENSPIVVPVYGGKRGNPVLFAKSLFPEVMKVRRDVGAKSVVKKHGRKVLEIRVRDAGVLLDVDTQADYEEAISVLRTRGTRSRAAGGPRHGPRRRSG